MKKIAFVQCVGSRDPSCGQDHCSTICCMYATKQAMIAKDRTSGLGVTFFYMDIRPMGKDYERYYERERQITESYTSDAPSPLLKKCRARRTPDHPRQRRRDL